jgi:hypothetical protein
MPFLHWVKMLNVSVYSQSITFKQEKSSQKKIVAEPHVVAQIWNIWEAEAGTGGSRVWGQPKQCSEILSQKIKR